MPVMIGIMGSVWEHYGWCVGALWVVCGSIRERNYRLKKKNYLSGPSVDQILDRYRGNRSRKGQLIVQKHHKQL